MPITINGSGTITGVSVGGLPDGIVDADMLASSVTTGKVIAVKQAIKTDEASESLAQGAIGSAICSISHAAASASNKIWLYGTMSIGSSTGSQRVGCVLYINGSVSAARGDANGNRSRLTASPYIKDAHGLTSANFAYLHSSPSTSAVTYDMRPWQGDNTTRTVYINTEKDDSDDSYHQTCMSQLTLMEIAA